MQINRLVLTSPFLAIFPAMFLAISGCVAQPAPATTPMPAPGPGPAPAAVPAPPAAEALPTSGGPTMAAADALTLGATTEGVVAMGGELFYWFDAEADQEMVFTFYAEGLWDGRSGMNMNFLILDENGGKLADRSAAVYSTHLSSDMDRSELKFKPKASGKLFVQVKCDRCKADVHYKIAAQ